MRALGRGLLVIAAALCVAAPAQADRKPTAEEEAAIERVGVQACAKPPGDCAFRGARVSTANERYAWANVIADGFSGALVKRPSRASADFRVVGTQGGGIGECRYWRKRAPRRVLKDLRIRGLVKSGAVRNCGKRR
jgi:hypothetical protein